MLRFAIVTVFTLAAVALGSLAWPKFTSQPRPKEMQVVRDAVLKTPAGQGAANVIGVTDGDNVQPVNLGTVASSISTTIINSLGQKVTEVVSNQAATVLFNQYKQLPPPAQLELQQSICKP